jgi:ribonuclease PH
VMSGAGQWIELQVSGEQRPMTATEMTSLQQLAQKGIAELFILQQQVLGLAR